VWPAKSADDDGNLRDFTRIEREILKARGILSSDQAKTFLDHENTEEDDPFILKGMQAAVDRISQAKVNKERVIIYGDYDADGITATAVLVEVLRKLGIDTDYFIPERISQGYGLHKDVLQELKSKGTDLVISVDCGIRAVEAIDTANDIGLDVIVTDHHEIGPQIPHATAVINPKQEGDLYPFKGFAGVGIAYKLSRALLQTLGVNEKKPLLDIVALGTIADLAPLDFENRNLVARGLEQLAKTERSGLVELMQLAGASDRRISTATIAFGLGPRINAIGRIDSAYKAVELLLTDDADAAFQLATELDQTNRKRQRMTTEIVKLAKQKLEEQYEIMDILFVGDESFHEGIIGLAASRLSDEYYRPAIVANTSKEITRASARSIPGFNITSALEECSDILLRYGGHAAAAGFSLYTKDIELFQEKISRIARDKLEGMELIPSVEIEAEVNLNELTHGFLDFLDRVQPCGIGNPMPLLGAKDVEIHSSRQVGKGRNHLKLMLKQKGQIFDSIAFNQGYLMKQLNPTIDIAFHFERNDYMGIEGRQLNVRAINT
jgi:single-stranded-DNA-specific exonuclease